MKLPLFENDYFTESAKEQEDTEAKIVQSDISFADTPLDYSMIIEKEAFQGDYSIDVILEGLEQQFTNYIENEDNTNYVDIFYVQMNNSRKILKNEDEEHPVEIREALDNIESRFIDKMRFLLYENLSITIADLEAGMTPIDLEYIFRRLYEFFILKAKQNFMKVISIDILSSINTIIEDDSKFFETVREMLHQYSPIVIAMGPMEFLQLAGNHEVYKLFEDEKVLGNFLKNYKCNLYKHQDFEVDIINNIVIMEDTDGSEDTN